MAEKHIPTEDRCPLCRSTDWRSWKALRLYGHQVCGACYYGFAKRRQLAFVFDLICLWGISWLASMVAGRIDPALGAALSRSLTPAGIAALTIGMILFGFRDGFAGHSPGKALAGLQVVTADTLQPIGFGRSFVRNSPFFGITAVTVMLVQLLGRQASIAGLIGWVLIGVMAGYMYRGPRWGDGLANTKVIRKILRFRVPFDTRGLYCTNCGYDLRGSVSSMCSECGVPITPPMARRVETN